MTDLEAIISECESKAVPDSEIDTSEIPPVTDFSGFYFGKQKHCNPQQKEKVTVLFSKVLLEHFRSKGEGWQAQVNDFLLSAYMHGQI